MLLIGVAMLSALVIVFLIGLQKRPRTTLLSYALAVLFGMIGNSIGFPALVFLGFAAGIVIGRYRFTDTPYDVFASRVYTIVLMAANGGGILLSIGLIGRMIDDLGPYLIESWGNALILMVLLGLPGIIGVTYLVGTYRQ